MLSTLLLSLALACETPGTLSPTAAPAIVSATLAIDSTTIVVGQMAKAAVVLRDSAGTPLSGRPVTWTSRNTNLATVSATGDITGIAPGTAIIDATSEGMVASAAIVVRALSTAPAPVPVAPAPVASVTVTIDSASLAPGHAARATAVLKSAAGATLVGRAVSWTSLQPAIATVSSLGVITAVAPGTATIQATSEGRSGSAAIRVATATVPAPAPAPVPVDPSAPLPDLLASHDFENGTLGPYTNPWGTDIDVVADPSGSGHGKVARIHYVGTNQDRNRAVSYELPAGRALGQSIYFKGQLYLPPDINTSPLFAGRKLLYWQRDAGATMDFGSIVTMFGTELKVLNYYKPVTGPLVETQSPVVATLSAGKWYTIETQLTLNSSFAAKDGVYRLWLDGVLLYEKTNLTWSDPAWTYAPSSQRLRYFQVGDQVNSSLAFDEYRYWDNLKFGTKRITP